MNLFTRLIFLFVVTLFLNSCGQSSSPKTNEEIDVDELLTSYDCEFQNEDSVEISIKDFSVSASNTGHKLYLEDFFNALQAADSEALTSEEQQSLNTITSKINEYLAYEITQGRVTGADNPLDFVEHYISDPALTGPIKEAKETLAAFIENNGDSFCNYRNRNIFINDLEGNNLLALLLDLNFDPFRRTFYQTLILSDNSSSSGSTDTNLSARYNGFSVAGSDGFSNGTFPQPEVRTATITNSAANETLFLDESYDIKQGVVSLFFTDTYCDQNTVGPDPRHYSDCATGIQTREVQKQQCDGSNEDYTNEVNKLAIHSFDINAGLTGIKRLRIETDYMTDEVKVFASNYEEAILDSDGISVIKNPTDCEKQAVLDELIALNPGSLGIRLTTVPDENYDIQYLTDENGELMEIKEPVPVIHFLGSPVASRK